jgi:hypothetical protein
MLKEYHYFKLSSKKFNGKNLGLKVYFYVILYLNIVDIIIIYIIINFRTYRIN